MAETIQFEVESLLAALPEGIDVGLPLCGDWRIEDVYWSRDNAIQFQIGRGKGTSFAVLVLPRDDSRPAFKRTRAFNIIHLSHYGRDPVLKDLNAQLSLHKLASALQWADRGDRSWKFPEALPQASYIGHSSPEERSLNLAIESPCSERCNFCSLPTIQPPLTTFDDAYHAGLMSELDRGMREGAKRLRINGIDPLTYPRLFEIVDHAREIGYTHADVYTTALPLADESFCKRLLDALPASRAINVPLYGGTPAVHDLVTGHAGSFEKIVAALENLARYAKPTEVEVVAVIVRQNLEDLVNARAVAKRFKFTFSAHMPFPSFGGSLDQYNNVAPRLSDAVEVLHALKPAIPVVEAPPCVLLRHEQRTGIPSLSRISPRQWRAFGRAYRSTNYLQSGGPGLTPTAPAVPCPNAESCAAADRCTREAYRAYVDLYGWSEFQAVARHELAPATETSTGR